MITKINVNGEWIDGFPVNGQEFKEIVDGVVVRQSYYAEPVNPYIGVMTVKVNGAETNRASLTVNESAIFTVECSLPINDSFKVPLAGLFGTIGKTLDFEFVNGIAERSVTFTQSGEYKVTEDQINLHLPEGSWFKFSGLSISVGE